MVAQVGFQYDLFLSYAEADHAWVLGYLLPSLGVSPEHLITPQNFRPGAPAVAEFERAITGSRYTVLVLSPAYLADVRATFSEQLSAHASVAEQRDRLIPLLLQPCTLPLRLDFRVRLDCTDEANWAGEVTRLRALLDQPEPPLERIACPYPGMRPFGEADSGRFFGRDQEVRELLECLRLHPFLTVIGRSGSGKSSLVFAGLVPALRKSGLFGPGEWLVRTLRPGKAPLAALTDTLGGDPANADQTVLELLATQPNARRLLLVVDQFEEVFTVARTDVGLFQQAVLRLAETPSCSLVLTVRADFYADLMATPLWRRMQAHRFEVLPLDGQGLRAAIVRPAEAEDVGVCVEPALVERLVADAAEEPGILPLVQETLVLVWERLQRRFLPLSAYATLGDRHRTGLQVAMARRADATLADLTRKQQTIARRIFLRLVQFGEGRPDTRRQQPVAALRSTDDEPAQFDQTLGHLTNNRLLTLSSEEEGEEKKVDMAHEALIAGWPTLQDWLKARREAELTRRRLQDKAEEWRRLGQASGGLLDEVELGEAEDWLASADAADLGHSEVLSALVQTSRATRTEEAAWRRRTARFRRGAVRVIVLLIIAAVGISWWSARQVAHEQRKAAEDAIESARRQQELRQHAEQQTQFALSRLSYQLATQALSYLDSQLDLALLLSVEASQIANTFAARKSLLTALQSQPQLTIFIFPDGHSYRMWRSTFRPYSTGRLAFSPDRQTVALGSEDGTISLWNAMTSRPIGKLLKERGVPVHSVVFSPDGKTLAAGCDNNKIVLWDVATHRPRGSPLFANAKAPVLSMAFSPDGKTLASGNYDDVILWDVVTGTQLARLHPPGDHGWVQSVVFGPDGTTLAAGSKGGVIILWDVTTRQLLAQPFSGHSQSVNSVAFSPDGTTLASGSCSRLDPDTTDCNRGEIRLWQLDVIPPLDPLSLTGHTKKVRSVVFGPDGTLVSEGDDGTIMLWDVAARQRLGRPLTGTSGAVQSVAFSPDGKTLVAGGCGGVDPHTRGCNKGEIRLWNVDTRQPLDPPHTGHTKEIWGVAFSPDGQRLVSGSADGTIILWDVAARPPLGQLLLGHTEQVQSMAFSPDGKTFALGSCGPGDTGTESCDQGEIRLWDVTTGQPLGSLFPGHDTIVESMAFSPDGQKLVSGGTDGMILLWDVTTRQPLGSLFTGHAYPVRSMAFSPDGTTLASGGCGEFRPGTDDEVYCAKGEIRLWDVATRKQLDPRLTDHKEQVSTVAFSLDGKTLASGSNDGTVILWVSTVAFSLDGKTLASGSNDGTVILWDVAARQPLSPPLTGSARSVAFSPDGMTLASGGSDGTIILWDISLKSWQDYACRIANRNLSSDEWHKLIGPDVPYKRTCPDPPSGKGVLLHTPASTH